MSEREKLGVLLLAALAARAACPWPLGTLWGPAIVGLLVAASFPIWAFAAWQCGLPKTGAALAFCWLALSAGYAVEALPDRSEFGSAGHAAAAFLVLFAIGWVGEGRWKEYGLGLDLTRKCVRRSLAITVAVIAAFVAVELGLWWMGVVSREDLGRPRGAFLEALLFQLVIVAVEEELLWRGLLQSRLDALLERQVRFAGASLGYGALLSFLLFGLTHMVRLELQPLHVSFQPSGAIVMGAVFVYLRALTGSIWPAVALHGLWNGHNVIVKALVWS